MDVTFFENKSFFGNDHLQGGKANEDSPELFENLIISKDVYTSHNSVPCTSAPKENALKKLDEHTPSMSKDQSESEATNQNIDQTNIFSEINQNAADKDPYSETEKRFEEGNPIWKGKIFARRKNDQVVEDHIPQLSQESEPSESQPTQIGKSLLDPNSLYTNLDVPIELRKQYIDLNVPIAFRKLGRSCTKHPLSNFVSYSNLSSSFVAFTSNLSSVQIPKNVQEALEIPKWKEAVFEEIKALEKNKTWSVTTLPAGKRTVGCKWVFTIKCNSDGSIERYKARLVAKGFTQTYGIDYSETFAPVAKLNTIRILLSLAANLDWPLHQLDIKNAFLNGDLEEEVYMDCPPGFEKKFGSQVCKLKKSLYGLKQSPRAWFEKFTQFVKKQEYTQGQADHTLFTKSGQNGMITVLIVYVDDIILTGNDEIEMERLKRNLAADFEIKDLGPLKYFLGMEVARSNKGIVVS